MSKRIFQYADGSVRDFGKREYTNAIVLDDGEITEIIKRVRTMANQINSLAAGMPGRPVVPERDEIFATLEAAFCSRCGGSGKIKRLQASRDFSPCDSCGGNGWIPIDDASTYTVTDPPEVKFADAFHTALTKGNTILELRMELTGDKGEFVSVPCNVVRNREEFTFQSDPIGVRMTMVLARVLDQFDQMIVTREDKVVVDPGHSIILTFEAAAV